MNYWLVKSEPEDYSWATFVKDGWTAWAGVRNFAARNHLRAMKRGDLVFFYHSGKAKEIVGIAKAVTGPHPDTEADEPGWLCVDFRPVKALAKPVSLKTIKADKALKTMALVKQSRLSVSPLDEKQFNRVLELAGTKI